MVPTMLARARIQVLLFGLFALGCGGGAHSGPTYDEFLVELPDAICDYYQRCGRISASERATCPDDLKDDIQDYLCDAARGRYQDLVAGLARCVDGTPKPCGKTDDLDVFCPSLGLLEDSCRVTR